MILEIRMRVVPAGPFLFFFPLLRKLWQGWREVWFHHGSRLVMPVCYVEGVMVMVVVVATEVVLRVAILWDIDSRWLWMFDDV